MSTPADQWMSASQAAQPTGPEQTRATVAGIAAAITFTVAVVVALLVADLAVGIVLLFLVFVPLEKLFALRRQRVFRRGFGTDLAHFVVNNVLVTAATIGVVVVAALPFLWIRSFALADYLPDVVAVVLAFVAVLVGGYWGHRFTHEIPFLWRFHAVHHSIEQMDWLASGRLHPLDAAFVQACGLLPLFLLGYEGAVFAGVTVFLVLIAIFQHANVRLRFPVVRWIINTPEWHHWHHAIEPEARNKNYGLPIVDKLFGTAYLPRGKRPAAFGIPDPVPEVGYVNHLTYPFTAAARDES